ncbi:MULTISPECIES: TetR/AcrR family transcriptional regulator [unclassified Microbacterium]|uniref:TetR/AcrR family transcriptional regulator n=1 Tax=unclassified Microbacterium TaxID=2609290 RepID=UPI00214C3B9E|nr:MULTISPECIES: TetR/AcrR family transcriptional regulator [unclassified Microbacterium]MCR2810984.1 TetR/AcrR family transcriptional regulator [Microbacterium sp. zg.B185]WIM19618.1 TetR/AcrR family transcriptional regulator [Microbacterium sp. zg-B185]
MVAPVKTPRSTYRQEQAEATKLRIADAAQTLFASQGYGATSMEAIARAAGVANRTVYAAVGAKRHILTLICERWLERARAVPRAAAVLDEPDPVARLRGAAGWITALYSTDFDVALILDSAVDEDPETRELLRTKLRGRNRVMDRFIDSVEPALSLPPADARAIYRALAATGVYGGLVGDAGWSPDRFERWLADTLVGQLLT